MYLAGTYYLPTAFSVVFLSSGVVAVAGGVSGNLCLVVATLASSTFSAMIAGLQVGFVVT